MLSMNLFVLLLYTFVCVLHNTQQIVKNDGLKGILKKETCRKVSLRANTQADMIEWVTKLKATNCDEHITEDDLREAYFPNYNYNNNNNNNNNNKQHHANSDSIDSTTAATADNTRETTPQAVDNSESS
jgi:hypothetical protein